MDNILTYIVNFIPTIVTYDFVIFFVGAFVISSMFGIILSRLCK